MEKELSNIFNTSEIEKRILNFKKKLKSLKKNNSKIEEEFKDIKQGLFFFRKEVEKKEIWFKKALKFLKNLYVKVLFFLLKPLVNRINYINERLYELNLKNYYFSRDNLKNSMEFTIDNHKYIYNLLREIKEELPGGIPKNFNYIKFENLFRGTEDEVKKRQQSYVKYFINKGRVFDLACGRGEFLKLLKENNIEALGIEKNKEMAKICKEKGLNVIVDDMFCFLENIEDKGLENVFLAEVIEHLSFFKVVKLLNLLYKKMKKDSVLLIETINPLVYYSFTNNFIVDPTHKTFIHPSLLVFMLEDIGFKGIDLKYISPLGEDKRLEKILSEDIPAYLREKLNNNINKLNDTLFGYQEYFILSRR